MSVKQYETYLAETFIEWVGGIIQPGERYQFKSPDPDNALKLWEAFVSLADGNRLKLRRQYIDCLPAMVFSLFLYCTEPRLQHSQKTTFLICAMKLQGAAAFLPKQRC